MSDREVCDFCYEECDDCYWLDGGELVCPNCVDNGVVDLVEA